MFCKFDISHGFMMFYIYEYLTYHYLYLTFIIIPQIHTRNRTTRPWWATYDVSIASLLDTIDLVITALHCSTVWTNLLYFVIDKGVLQQLTNWANDDQVNWSIYDSISPEAFIQYDCSTFSGKAPLRNKAYDEKHGPVLCIFMFYNLAGATCWFECRVFEVLQI